MIVAIHQPQYLPWLGYFDKIDQADVFCFLDDVQYKKNEYQNRNRIKTPQGWQWLTVPVHYRFPWKIDEVTIENGVKWGRKHFQAICTNYGKAPFFKRYAGIFEEMLERQWTSLADLNIEFVQRLCEALEMEDVRTVRSSEMVLTQEPTQRLIDICRRLGGDTYLAGAGGAGYMDVDKFEVSGIRLVFQSFQHPVYPQMFGPFEPYMSVADLLMNCGPDSMSAVRNAQKRDKSVQEGNGTKYPG